MNDKMALPVAFARWQTVISETGLPQNSIRDLIRAGKFPAPVQLGPRSVGFIRGEIEAWKAARIAARGGLENGR